MTVVIVALLAGSTFAYYFCFHKTRQQELSFDRQTEDISTLKSKKKNDANGSGSIKHTTKTRGSLKSGASACLLVYTLTRPSWSQIFSSKISIPKFIYTEIAAFCSSLTSSVISSIDTISILL